MTEIYVTKEKKDSFKVVVKEDHTETTHVVTLSKDVYEALTQSKCSEEELVKESFLFLLEREPKETILQTFELMVINTYFPEYTSEIKKRIVASF